MLFRQFAVSHLLQPLISASINKGRRRKGPGHPVASSHGKIRMFLSGRICVCECGHSHTCIHLLTILISSMCVKRFPIFVALDPIIGHIIIFRFPLAIPLVSIPSLWIIIQNWLFFVELIVLSVVTVPFHLLFFLDISKNLLFKILQEHSCKHSPRSIACISLVIQKIIPYRCF